MQFHLVDDGVPEISKNIIQEACRTREVEYIEHDSRKFVFEPESKVKPGNILFRPAVSQIAMRVEQFLYQPGVSTFYTDTWGILNYCNNSIVQFEANDIPIPRTFYINQNTRSVLDYYVEQLGGYPVVLKVLGHSSGIGVMKLDSKSTLYSVVDFVTAGGQVPILSAFVDNAVHWRCLVVGKKVIAGYVNPQEEGDFRTYGSTNKEDIFTEVDAEMNLIALNATQSLGVELGGVDMLRHESGRLYVLECNYPCYFAHAQQYGDVDVAGQIVDYLIDKARCPDAM